jgi:cyclopropane-fatty-acyl-phospholipid synthase
MFQVLKSAADLLSGSGNLTNEADSRRTALVEACHPRFGVAGIDLVLPSGKRVRSGAPAVATLRFQDWRAVAAFLLRDQAGLFECYLQERLDLEPGSSDPAESLLGVIKALDEQSTDWHWVGAALSSSRYFWQQNTAARRAALSVHYSVPVAFWLSLLSEEYPIYSHYLFEEHETHEAWERACERKLEYALRVCQLRPGERVLNVGEGWGGFMAYAGRRGVSVTGTTLNDQSYKACRAKRKAEGLEATCEVVKTDFYDYQSHAPFDAITNMGVTEHLTDYDRLLTQYSRLLKSGGYVYSDFVGTTRDAPFRSLIQQHVYPGAAAVYLPRLLNAVERNQGFDVVTVFDDRLSYDKTCVAWARNAEAHRGTIVEGFGEMRYRWIWSYLWMSVYGFRTYHVGITGTRLLLRKR